MPVIIKFVNICHSINVCLFIATFSVDVADLWTQSCRKQEVELAPTREMVSSQYHTQHRLDTLRKAACSLFRSEEVAKVLSKVAVHVDKKLIVIRADRDLHLDFGE